MTNIIDILLDERLYQLKRWGKRQPDGTFKENKHEVAAYIYYTCNTA